jgi:UDP-N-acetylglucosamine transferase subunit ALG13
MIYVTIGGTKIPFIRLISKIDQIAQKLSSEEFVVQQGISNYKFISKNVKFFNYCSYEESDEYIKKSKVIISHAGTGTIVQAKQYGIPLIIVPRLKKYSEHVDNHQLDIATFFEKEDNKNIFVVKDIEKLEEVLIQVLKLKIEPVTEIYTGKSKILEEIEQFIKKHSKKNLLVINSLDTTYGSTHRFRKLVFPFIEKDEFNICYIESNTELSFAINIKQKNNAFGFFFGTLVRMYYTFIKKFDILFTQTITPLTVGCVLIAKLKGKKNFVDWDDLSWVLQKNLFRSVLVKFCEHKFIKYVDVIFVPNKYLLEYAKNLGVKNVYFVPHGIDFDLFNPEKYDKTKVRNKLGILENKIVLGFLASFTTGGVGDLDFIYEVVKEILDNRDDIYFLIIGGGPLFEEYRKLEEKIGLKNTIFTGLIKQNEVPEYLSCVDIALIYMRDNLKNKMKTSLKVGEYLAMNKIVVGHLVGQTKDDFEKYCIICGEDKESFKQKIEETIDKYKNGKLEIQNFRDKLQKIYTWDNAYCVIEKILKSMVVEEEE